MAMKDSEFLKKWKKAELNRPPYIFPKDKEIIKKLEKKGKIITYYTVKDYINSKEFANRKDTTLHIGLKPLPFAGYLRKASIYILTANPGLSPVDYYIEESDQKYVRDIENNIKQFNDKSKYPMFLLNPKYSWYAGFEYWEEKLRDIIDLLMINKKMQYKEALRFVSKKIATVELLPYHSRNFGLSENELSKFESVKLVREFAQKELVKLANNGEAIIIVIRKANHWDIKENKNIIVYDKNEARGASLSSESRGGKAILEKLNIS